MKWIRKNLQKLSVKAACEYINTKLLKDLSERTLAAHRITLPISKNTAWKWMIKCKASRCDTNKTYYNDHHQKPEVIKHRTQYIQDVKRL